MTNPKPRPFSIGRLNAWRMHKQWLDRPYTGKSPLKLIRSIGWLHSPGSATPYLSLWARMSSFSVATLNRLVFEEQKLIPLETLRGATMLVPTEQVVVALRVRTRTFTDLSEQAGDILPLAPRELEQLKSAVLGSLESGTRRADEILNAVPSGLIREFPSTLRRIGITDSLRLAINLLKEEGRIVQVPVGKRLDTDECAFGLLSNVLPQIDPFELKPELANTALAASYFAAEGPARIKDFAWWSSLHVTEAMRAAAAVKPGLKPVAVEGSRDEFLILGSHLDELVEFQSVPEAINLIPFRDIYLKGQREIAVRFMRPQHSDKPFPRFHGRLSNDPAATVLHNGEVVGIWEWNTAGKGKLDFVLFDDTVPATVRRSVGKRAAMLGDFIRNELGDIRTPFDEVGRSSGIGIHDLKETWDPAHVINA